MTPASAVVTARVPRDLVTRIDALVNEQRKRGHIIHDALEQWLRLEEGTDDVALSGEPGEIQALKDMNRAQAATIADLRAQLAAGTDTDALENALGEANEIIGELRAQLAAGPARRASDGDHQQPPVPTKRRKQAWETLRTFQSVKIGGLTAGDVLGAMELRLGKRLPQNGIAKRVSELHAGGYITSDPRKAADPDGAWATAHDDRHAPYTKAGRETGAFTRPNPFGTAAIVYWVTQAGVDHFNNPPKP